MISRTYAPYLTLARFLPTPDPIAPEIDATSVPGAPPRSSSRIDPSHMPLLSPTLLGLRCLETRSPAWFLRSPCCLALSTSTARLQHGHAPWNSTWYRMHLVCHAAPTLGRIPPNLGITITSCA